MERWSWLVRCTFRFPWVFVQGGDLSPLEAARALKGESKAGRSSLGQYMSDGYNKKAAVQGDLNWRPQGLAAARHRASF